MPSTLGNISFSSSWAASTWSVFINWPLSMAALVWYSKGTVPNLDPKWPDHLIFFQYVVFLVAPPSHVHLFATAASLRHPHTYNGKCHGYDNDYCSLFQLWHTCIFAVALAFASISCEGIPGCLEISCFMNADLVGQFPVSARNIEWELEKRAPSLHIIAIATFQYPYVGISSDTVP